MYVGDFTPGKTIRKFFNTRATTGAPITLAGTPAISIYKDGGTTESTTGVTLTVDFDSRTGLHLVAIDTSADGTFYSAGSDFELVITTGTVDSVSQVGVSVGKFSLSNRSALRPTTADRTLDVSAGGEAGLDWANVGSPTTSLNLSGTTISTSQAVTSVSGAVGSVTGNVGGNVTGSVGSVVGNVGGNVTGSVGSVSAGVTVSDKTGFSLASNGLASVTAWTVAITGNITGNLSGSVGSVTGNVGGSVDSVVNPVTVTGLTIPTAEQNADALLDRTVMGGGNGDNTVGEALGFLRNKWAVVGTTLTVFETDGTTPWWTGTVTTNASADPITGVATS